MELQFEDGDFPAALAPLPAAPTFAPPGTPEKLAVMAQRYARREQLTHPCDARREGDSIPTDFIAATPEIRAQLLAVHGAKPTGFSLFFGNLLKKD